MRLPSADRAQGRTVKLEAGVDGLLNPMVNSSTRNSKEHAASESPDLVELRRILVGREKIRIHQLEEKLKNPEIQAKHLSQALPKAIRLRETPDNELTRALSPTVEQIIEESVRRNPQTLVRALFPILGSIVRKAVASALRNMLQNFNRTLDQSLSPRSIRWRIEAWRTGKPFAEVVLLHTLEYRVEQVFLIHRETGLLLAHVVAEAVEPQDPSLISAMLTAIADFVQDSFRVSKDQRLEMLQFPGFGVLVEEGPTAVLAAVVRGTPPGSLGDELERVLEQVHLEFGALLQELPDDTEPFRAAEPLLAECFQTRLKSQFREKHGFSPLFWAAAGVLLFLCATLLFFLLRDQLRWKDFLARLDEENGIVVTEARRGLRSYRVIGLRDPLSAEPAAIAREAGLDTARLSESWEAYFALDPEIVEARVGQILDPPESVRLDMTNGILSLAGSASQAWIVQAASRAAVIPGIRQVETSALRDSTLEQLVRNIEDAQVLFAEGSSGIRQDQRGKLDQLAAELQRLESWAQTASQEIRLEIQGGTDPSGTPASNRLLGERRALAVQEALRSIGVTFNRIRPAVVSTLATTDTSLETHGSLRRVGFRVVPMDSRGASGERQ